ncbi:MAG: phosphate acetyltransferase [Clostridium sp.]|nr:phosphate acetyltransferase [Prevotella sp.]MCM1429509.1 phosphate acetyltransferase [Clostridium sp.]MCM1476125.1 phosphate acetyltransferase [Muribaculaceae bacterium]
MNLFERLTKKAKEHPQRLILPESTEPRTLQAADHILANSLAEVNFIGKKEEIYAEADKLGLKNIAKANIFDPEDITFTEKYAELFAELRKKKGITVEQAREIVKNPLYLGCLMIKAADADCMVAGALSPTSHVLRAAFQVLKTKPGISCVSGAFIMLLPEGSKYGDRDMLVFADCAVVPDPTMEELAQIAVETAKTTKNIAGLDPVVAMLSFSTYGSASHEKVDKVRGAVELVHKMDPELKVDGEMQSDAAIVPEIGAKKAPGSSVAGHANTLIFPSLETGNIAYKLVQRLAGAGAVGPILQGLAAPVNDLSRGATVEDIINTIIVTCNQAIGEKNL